MRRLGARREVMDDTPLSEAGYWSTYDAEADIRATMGEAGFAQGWALYGPLL